MKQIIAVAFFMNLFVCINVYATTTKSISIPKAGVLPEEVDAKIDAKLESENYVKQGDLDVFATKAEVPGTIVSVISSDSDTQAQIVTALTNNSNFNSAIRNAVPNNMVTKDELPKNIGKLDITSDGKINISSVYNLQDTLNNLGNSAGGTTGLSQEQLATLNAAINAKADNSALISKADQNYVDTELNKKVNTTDMQTALAGKADKSYVDAAVQNADLSTSLLDYVKKNDLSGYGYTTTDAVTTTVNSAMNIKFYSDNASNIAERGNLKSEFLPTNIESLPDTISKLDLTSVSKNEVNNTENFDKNSVYVWVYDPSSQQMGWAQMDSSTIRFQSK